MQILEQTANAFFLSRAGKYPTLKLVKVEPTDEIPLSSKKVYQTLKEVYPAVGASRNAVSPRGLIKETSRENVEVFYASRFKSVFQRNRNHFTALFL